VVVAVALVGPVEAPGDQEVHVVAVGDGVVTAARPVDVVVPVAVSHLGVTVGMAGVDRDDVLVDVITVRMVQVAVM